MIGTQLNYDQEDSIRAALGSQHYILEAIMAEEFPLQGFRDLLMKCKERTRERKKRKLIDYLRTHLPTRVIEFSGLGRGNMEWWCGVLKLKSTIKGRVPVYFLMVGWKNKHGIEATVVRYDEHSDVLLSDYTRRVAAKINTGYESDVCWEHIEIRRSTELPVLPGLGKPPKIDWKKTEAKPMPSILAEPISPRVKALQEKKEKQKKATKKELFGWEQMFEEFSSMKPEGIIEGAEEIAKKISEKETNPELLEAVWEEAFTEPKRPKAKRSTKTKRKTPEMLEAERLQEMEEREEESEW